MAAANDMTRGIAYDETLAALGDAARTILEASSSDPASMLQAAPKPARAVVLVAQAYVQWLTSALRYMGRAGFSSAAYGRLLAWQLGSIAVGQGNEGVRTLVDESIAQLREIGDLSVQEALALQKLLGRLGEELRHLEDEELGEPRRYAKPKP